MVDLATTSARHVYIEVSTVDSHNKRMEIVLPFLDLEHVADNFSDDSFVVFVANYELRHLDVFSLFNLVRITIKLLVFVGLFILCAALRETYVSGVWEVLSYKVQLLFEPGRVPGLYGTTEKIKLPRLVK